MNDHAVQRKEPGMKYSTAGVKRVVGQGGASGVSFHDAWSLSQSEALYQLGGFSPTETEEEYRPLVQPISYASSF
jgi:hypothetical protein